jgi:hypothetical protein
MGLKRQENNEIGFFYRCTVYLGITKVFHSPTDGLLLMLENSKIHIKTY